MAQYEPVSNPNYQHLSKSGATIDGSAVEITKNYESAQDGVFLHVDEQAILWKMAFGVFDLITILSPLLFTALAIAASRLDSKPANDAKNGGSLILNAIKLGPTVYPIIFAAVAGRSLSTIARHISERGAKLGTLEQLMSSHTLFGTVESQISLRIFGWLGPVLLSLWILSPLGGQASLRLVTVSPRSSTFNQTISYFSTNQSSIFNGASGTSTYGPFVSAIYASTMLAANRTASDPMDTWGNLRIPKFESLPGKADDHGWKPVGRTNVVFSSLVGLPLINANTSRNTQLGFTIQSSYLNWNLLSIKNETIQGDWMQSLRIPWGSSNTSAIDPFQQYQQTIFLDTPTPSSGRLNGAAKSPRYVVFGSHADNARVVLANFSVTQTRVESRVLCEDSSCRVTDIRLSKEDTLSQYFTCLEDAEVIAGNLFATFARADGKVGGGGRSQATENYIETLSYSPRFQFANLSAVSLQDFAARFSILFNTFYASSVAPLGLTGSASQSLGDYKPESYALGPGIFTTSGSSNGSGYGLRRAPGTATITQSVYKSHPTWIGFLLLSSIILFILGIIGLIAKYTSLSPETMGFVSSITRDNEFFTNVRDEKGREPSSALDGFDRARLLKNVKVRVIDTAGGDAVGRIAFVPVGGWAGDQGLGQVRLRRGRRYR